jgi:hypothetical protein
MARFDYLKAVQFLAHAPEAVNDRSTEEWVHLLRRLWIKRELPKWAVKVDVALDLERGLLVLIRTGIARADFDVLNVSLLALSSLVDHLRYEYDEEGNKVHLALKSINSPGQVFDTFLDLLAVDWPTVRRAELQQSLSFVWSKVSPETYVWRGNRWTPEGTVLPDLQYAHQLSELIDVCAKLTPLVNCPWCSEIELALAGALVQHPDIAALVRSWPDVESCHLPSWPFTLDPALHTRTTQGRVELECKHHRVLIQSAPDVRVEVRRKHGIDFLIRRVGESADYVTTPERIEGIAQGFGLRVRITGQHLWLAIRGLLIEHIRRNGLIDAPELLMDLDSQVGAKVEVSEVAGTT